MLFSNNKTYLFLSQPSDRWCIFKNCCQYRLPSFQRAVALIAAVVATTVVATSLYTSSLWPCQQRWWWLTGGGTWWWWRRRKRRTSSRKSTLSMSKNWCNSFIMKYCWLERIKISVSDPDLRGSALKKAARNRTVAEGLEKKINYKRTISDTKFIITWNFLPGLLKSKFNLISNIFLKKVNFLKQC